MRELEPDNPEFTHEDQYRVIGWKIFFETMSKIGEKTKIGETHAPDKPRDDFDRLHPTVTIRALAYNLSIA